MFWSIRRRYHHLLQNIAGDYFLFEWHVEPRRGVYHFASMTFWYSMEALIPRTHDWKDSGVRTNQETESRKPRSGRLEHQIKKYPENYCCFFRIASILGHKKTPDTFVSGVLYLNLAMSYSHMGNPTLPSALSGFTSEFEKGSGGARSLLSPENWSKYRYPKINATLYLRLFKIQ